MSLENGWRNDLFGFPIRIKRLLSSVVTTLSMLFAANCAQADIVVFDHFDSASDFGPNGIVIATTHGGTPTSVATDVPGESGVVRLNNTVGTGGSGWYGHILTANFNPTTQGSINFIDYSVDIRDPDLGSRADGASSDVGMLLRQNGNYFIGPNFIPNDGTPDFLTFAESASAQDFVQIGPTPFGVIDGSHPDFSASGSTIDFGVVTRSGTGSGVITPTRIVDVRNLSISVSAVPEPASGVFGLALVLGTIAFRRRKLSI